jgi:serine phosphatase RsbU (regulator of sigma subunit)
MKLRIRLILAFLLLSVVPLAAVTLFSYVSNYRALQAAAMQEANELASELSERMQLVAVQLSERVEQLMEVSATAAATEVAEVVPPEPDVLDQEQLSLLVREQAADALGEAAMLLNSVELRGMRRGGGRGRRIPAGQPGETGDPGPPPESRGRRAGAPPPPSPPTPPLMPAPRGGTPASAGVRGSAGQSPPEEEDDRIRIDVGPIAREVFQDLVPEGTSAGELTGDQRRRIAAEINQRMTGINEGLRLAAAELQRKADEVRREAEAEAKARPSQAPAPMKRRSELSGSRLAVTLERDGQVVRTASAEINLPNVLMTVFSSVPRAQGEVPFAVGPEGRLYASTEAAREAVEPLSPAQLPNGASTLREWVVIMTEDPTGSGLRLGIARPVGDSLAALRRTAARNAGLGLLFIGLSIVVIVPLSGRLTRDLSILSGAVKRIAHGDYRTRVQLKSRDEIGELALAFNQMAADIEAHQRELVERERLKRELELGRQIQHDMQPQQPLRLGLTEIQGVSVPAREVGGDFFNYFALPDGQVVLLVGDVAGKGVGAALLMANIQASLRTRFALGQDLSSLADAIDRDIEANSPGPMYATVFISVLDPKTQRLRYVSAGHHPQYVLRPAGGLERMGATGLPAGLLAGRGYTEHEVQLEPGDLLFFYTDGCPETENDREEMFGAERLEALLLEAVQSADPLQRIERAVAEFRGTSEPLVDATLMTVKVV